MNLPYAVVLSFLVANLLCSVSNAQKTKLDKRELSNVQVTNADISKDGLIQTLIQLSNKLEQRCQELENRLELANKRIAQLENNHTVNIHADSGWQRTPIQSNGEGKVVLNCSGSWRLGGADHLKCGADGLPGVFANLRTKTMKAGALVGRWSGTEELFLVGTKKEIDMTGVKKGSVLFLTCNDAGESDNYGSIAVKIEVLPK